MLAFLFWTGTYFATGYFTFRVWTWRCRPQNGAFGNDWGDYFKKYDGWFTPSWVDTSSGEIYGSTRSYLRGQSVQVTFWQSVLTWPVVWLLVFVVKIFIGLNIMSRSICKAVCESVTKQLPPPQTIEKEYMIEGITEVEKLLRKEK